MPPKTPVCKFYAKGQCKNGNQCRFLHVDPQDTTVGNERRITTAAQFLSQDTAVLAKEIRLDLDAYGLIQMDPVLTCYGLSEFAVNNLIAGRDVSLEELRIQHMEAVQNNKVDDLLRQIDLKKKDMQYCIGVVREKDSVAARYQQVGITRGNIKPFIPKTVEESMRDLQNTGGNAFGAGNQFGQGSNAFGASNPFGAGNTSGNSSGFGSNGFGSSSTPSAFGNLSAGFGATGFGATAKAAPTGGAFEATTTAAPSGGAFGSTGFGALSNTGLAFGAGAFGQQSTNTGFGASSFGNSTATTKPFGGSTGGAFGSTGFGSTGFGLQNTGATNGFGTSQQSTGATGGFGSTGFGSAGFGNSGFGANAPTAPSAFGQSAATNPSPFGQASTSTTAPFGQAETTGFGKAATTSTASPFGQSQPFGAITSAAPFGQTQKTENPFGTTTSASAFGAAPAQNGSAFGASAFGASTQPPQPFGAPSDTNTPQGLEDLDPDVVKAFMAANFELGKIPDVAPPPQVC